MIAGPSEPSRINPLRLLPLPVFLAVAPRHNWTAATTADFPMIEIYDMLYSKEIRLYKGFQLNCNDYNQLWR